MKSINLFILIFLIHLPNAWCKKPLYEIGIAAGAGYISDYPGADQGRWRYIALPSFAYRGNIIRQDKRRTRARFFKSERLDIDLSFGASFPANSKDNKAREGMSDLDWLGEMGPRVNISFFEDDLHRLELELPVRAVASTDFKFTRQRGFRFYPQLDYTIKLNDKFRINTSLKMNWGSEELTDYFYEVTPQDATLEREEFDAKAGYLGSAVSVSTYYRYQKLFYGLGLRYSRFDNATNETSPLFQRTEDLTVFFAFNYFFYQSKEKGTK